MLQSLFEWDVRNKADSELPAIIARNATEFSPNGDLGFMTRLGENILKKRSDIDQVIEKAAPDWPLDRIASIDRNVLRIGLFELLLADRSEVPAKVAINEAIELAKTFGGEHSGRFVNGVLGAVYKEIGEPGKEETSKGKKKIPDVPFEKMPIKRLGGAVIYAREGPELYIALVHDVFGRWTLSKGRLKPEETEKGGVTRAIQEELGLPVTVEDKLGDNEYVASDPEEGKLRKQVCYFLAQSPFGEITLKETGGLDDARWFRAQDILELNFYDDILPVVTKALNILSKRKTAKTA